MPINSLMERIAMAPIMCDGAMKTQLVTEGFRRGLIATREYTFSTAQWNLEHPEVVAQPTMCKGSSDTATDYEGELRAPHAQEHWEGSNVSNAPTMAILIVGCVVELPVASGKE